MAKSVKDGQLYTYVPDHEAEKNFGKPLGDMAIWDDEIPVGMIPRDPQSVIDAQYVEIVDLRSAWYRAMAQRDTWACIAFGCGVLLGWLLRYV